GVALSEAPRPGGVVVLAGLGQPVAHAVLHPVVDDRDEAEHRAPLALLATAVDLADQVADVLGHRPLRMAVARLAPGEAVEPLVVPRHGVLELVLRRQAGQELAAVRHGPT